MCVRWLVGLLFNGGPVPNRLYPVLQSTCGVSSCNLHFIWQYVHVALRECRIMCSLRTWAYSNCNCRRKKCFTCGRACVQSWPMKSRKITQDCTSGLWSPRALYSAVAYILAAQYAHIATGPYNRFSVLTAGLLVTFRNFSGHDCTIPLHMCT